MSLLREVLTPSVVARDGNPSMQEGEAGVSGSQDHLQLLRKFKGSWASGDTVSKTENKTGKEVEAATSPLSAHR